MNLSKKNIDKLNKFIKNKRLINNPNISDPNIGNIKNNSSPQNLSNSKNPKEIFYSLIDNAETLDETSRINQTLRDSEKDNFNINSRGSDYTNNLTTEDELYDEFNYLLEE